VSTNDTYSCFDFVHLLRPWGYFLLEVTPLMFHTGYDLVLTHLHDVWRRNPFRTCIMMSVLCRFWSANLSFYHFVKQRCFLRIETTLGSSRGCNISKAVTIMFLIRADEYYQGIVHGFLWRKSMHPPIGFQYSPAQWIKDSNSHQWFERL